jgi:hypothetical protein
MTRPVRRQITTVSQKVPVDEDKGLPHGFFVCAAAATWERCPSPFVRKKPAGHTVTHRPQNAAADCASTARLRVNAGLTIRTIASGTASAERSGYPGIRRRSRPP